MKIKQVPMKRRDDERITFSMLGGEYHLVSRGVGKAILHDGEVMTINEAIDSMNTTMAANMTMIGEFVRVVSEVVNE